MISINKSLYNIRYQMKQYKSPFQQEDEQDLQDIVKILANLHKPKTQYQHHNKQVSNRSNLSKNKEKEQTQLDIESRPIITSNKYQDVDKKSHNILSIKPQIQQISLKNESNSAFNHNSNMSAQSLEQAQCCNNNQKTPEVEKQSFILKKTSQKITQKNKTVNTLQKQLRQLQQNYKEKEKLYSQQRNKQKLVLSNVLKEAFKCKIQYYQYLDFINGQRKKIIEEQVIQKNEPLLKSLKQEQLKYKPRKRIKNAQTMSLSDQQEFKLSESMEKQKKYYYAIVGSKIQKQREKFQSNILNQDKRKISIISQQRLVILRKEFSAIQIQPLCQIQGSNEKIQEILAIDLQKCSQVRIKSIPFNPTIPSQQRLKIYQKCLQTVVSTKKIMPNSNNHIFNQNSSLFIPICHVFNRQDEILLINQCSQTSFPLNTFLKRLQLTTGEQQLHIVRYIVRVCIKGIQQINNELKHDNAIILPQNIYFNEKWQLKLENICLNQLIYHHFRHTLQDNDFYYFPPQQKQDKYSNSLWSLGMLIYFLCFSGQPFQKYQPYHWKSRQQFFMFNELQINHRSNAYDKCKDFIFLCLNKKGNINFNEICSEQFFTQTK